MASPRHLADRKMKRKMEAQSEKAEIINLNFDLALFSINGIIQITGSFRLQRVS